MAQEQEFYSRFPHPYVMDSKAMELKLAYSLAEDCPDRPKDMVREFVRYHAFCHHAMELLSCNIDRIAMCKSPHPYPEIPLPDYCKDDNKPWGKPDKPDTQE
jgi:hypothetical protein